MDVEYGKAFKEDTFVVIDSSTANSGICAVEVLNTDFANENNSWKQTKWEVIWSDTGSASDMVRLYWRHFFYGGF